MSDDEYEGYEPSPERIKALGFRPQREILINTLLPYADKLDEESVKLFDEIKTNLAKAVMLREMKPACGVWTSRLMKYLKLYGFKFSKEDHIALVKLVYELILIPDLEPSKVHKFVTLFIMLTKKRFLIAPSELTLPWRPLYEMGKRIFDKSRTHIGMYHYLSPKSDSSKESTSIVDMIRKFLSGSSLEGILTSFGISGQDSDVPTSLEGAYVGLVKCAKPYFETNATAEILALFRPQISLWSTDLHMMGQFVTYLPVSLPPKDAARGHELWFDEMMTLWDTCYNAQCGVSELMVLFSQLAKRNPGTVDWTPYVPKMFTRFMHAVNLPVSYKDMQYTRPHSLDTNNIATWIVWTIAPDGLVLKHLRIFLTGVESYLQSANAGRWSFKLKDLLRKLTKEFIARYRREREEKYKNSWENQTPDSYKLRDCDVTDFVTIVVEPTLLAVHSRTGTYDITPALQNLATLRPALVIPQLINRLRSSLESLTEPHRVTAAMTSVAAVTRAMLRGAAADYPEGPTHAVPLLMASLPGLDPNDFKKTIVTLHFILKFSWMMPYVDCSSASEYWPDLTEEERITCESTAQLEDFVLLFFERIFAIIESSVLENVRLESKESEAIKSKNESVLETALSSAATCILMQCSPKIFSEALRKFKKFATDSTFETNVSGSLVGMLVRIFAKVNSHDTLAAFVPPLCDDINELLSTEEALLDENPPNELIYRLLLLSHVVECNGEMLLKYIPHVTSVLDRALKVHSTDALARACDVLAHVMSSFSIIEIKEYRSSNRDYNTAPKEWLPIREWGHGCHVKDANFEWHTPSKAEVDKSQELLNRYMKPELERLRQWLEGSRDMGRERMVRCFQIVSSLLASGGLLPLPNEPPVPLVKTLVPATSFPLASGINGAYITLDGANVRVKLTELLLKIQEKMLKERADDTKGFELLLQVWDFVSGVRPSRGGPSIDARLRSYSASDRALDGKAGPPGGGRIRPLLADALRLQDEARRDLHSDAGIGKTELSILKAFFELSVNPYTTVRLLAQLRIYWILSHFAYSYRALLPPLCSLLREAGEGGEGEEAHARHKGALYIMYGPRASPLIAKQDWEVVGTLWPAILNAPLSEKPSILRLEQAFSDTLHRQFPAVNTTLTMTSGCVEAARHFLKDSELEDKEFMDNFNKAIETEQVTSERNVKSYNALLEKLVEIGETPNIQWRRLELVMQMLTYCPSLQTPYPPSAVRFIVNSLIHDHLPVRRTAIRLMHFVLKQRKKKVKKITVDPYEVAGVPKPEVHVPGFRKDNEWAIWSESRIPKNDEDWDKPWLRRSSTGFYAWPEKLEVAAPSSEQDPLDRDPSTLEEGERHIHDFFTSETKVTRLIGFLTAEEKKGKDKFSGSKFAMFRILFRSYGDSIANVFLESALKHASDSQEASQRFAAEIAAAAIRAPRYWPRDRALALYGKAVEVLKVGLNSVTPETMEDWGTCLASAVENLDPNRCAPVLEALMTLCAPHATDDVDTDKKSSFGVCARLYALQGALGSMTWRTAPLAADLLSRLEAAKFIQHPYQNVRESVGSFLMTLFDTELVFPNGDAGPAPRLAQFLASIKPKLAALYDEHGEIVIKTAASMPSGHCSAPETSVSTTEPELSRGETLIPVAVGRMSPDAPGTVEAPAPSGGGRVATSGPCAGMVSLADKALATRLEAALRLDGDSPPAGPKEHARAVNLLTTVLRGCMGIIVRGTGGATATQYRLLRTACSLSARGPPQPHDELGRAADGFLASLAMAHHGEPEFDVGLDAIEDVGASRSWWARLACVEFAQPFLFYGLPMLCKNPERAVRAEQFALKLMTDPRLEVRQAASNLLTGLMHCRALPDENRTINLLMKSCRSKEILKRHSGVLGLCAYLASRPYSLGPRIGEVLAELSRHTNAPDPVPSAIRKALANFRRTHQDDWPKHREALTEDELDLLADLTSPPSYCA